jgi:ketosteroid isomerase-like protein
MSDRSASLREPANPLVRRLFAMYKTGDMDGFAGLLREDSVFTFGNSGPVVGAAAVRAGLEQLFTVVNTISHTVLNEWSTGSDQIVEADVTYSRKDGKDVTVPCASIITFDDSDKIISYRILLDPSPLYAE